MSGKKGNVPGRDDKQDGDQFAEFGLTDEARKYFQAEEPKNEKRKAKGTRPLEKKTARQEPSDRIALQRAANPSGNNPPATQFRWQTADFEVRPAPLLRDCTNCFHHVRGGEFAVEKIVELKNSRRGNLHDLITNCKKHEREFELHELEQMIEKAKTLDTEFDEVPRIRHYCFAGSTSYALRAKIPEIKNFDGLCKDYLPGSRPWASCDACSHRNEHSLKRPGASARHVDVSGYVSMLRDPPPQGAQWVSRVIDSMRRERQHVEDMADMKEDEYDRKLSDDVMTMVYDNRPPRNGTLDQCKVNINRACAAENRTNHCPKFSAAERLETIASEARWRELTIKNKEYRDSAGRLIEAEQAKRALIENSPDRPPCFSCVHCRAPVSNDLFQEVHYNSPDIMNLRDSYRREKKQREAEERLVCTQPSNTLGSDFPPQRQVWCDKYSTRSADGKVNEFAYCLRVLKIKGGNCPSYEECRQDRPATVALPALPPPPAPAKPPGVPRRVEVLHEMHPLDPLMGGNTATEPSPSADLPSTFDKLRPTFRNSLMPLDWAKTPVPAATEPPEAASERKCRRCNTFALSLNNGKLYLQDGRVYGLYLRNGRMWCMTCGDWAAPP